MTIYYIRRRKNKDIHQLPIHRIRPNLDNDKYQKRVRNMKIAVASVFVLSLAAVSAFAPGKHSRVKPTQLNMSSPAEFVNTEIAAHDVVVFSKSFCPFCKKTKELFEDLKIDATVYELNQMDNGPDIQAALLELTGQRTVPNVFIKGKHLGGNDDTQGAAKSGKLQEMLGI